MKEKKLTSTVTQSWFLSTPLLAFAITSQILLIIPHTANADDQYCVSAEGLSGNNALCCTPEVKGPFSTALCAGDKTYIRNGDGATIKKHWPSAVCQQAVNACKSKVFVPYLIAGNKQSCGFGLSRSFNLYYCKTDEAAQKVDKSDGLGKKTTTPPKTTDTTTPVTPPSAPNPPVANGGGTGGTGTPGPASTAANADAKNAAQRAYDDANGAMGQAQKDLNDATQRVNAKYAQQELDKLRNTDGTLPNTAQVAALKDMAGIKDSPTQNSNPPKGSETPGTDPKKTNSNSSTSENGDIPPGDKPGQKPVVTSNSNANQNPNTSPSPAEVEVEKAKYAEQFKTTTPEGKVIADQQNVLNQEVAKPDYNAQKTGNPNATVPGEFARAKTELDNKDYPASTTDSQGAKKVANDVSSKVANLAQDGPATQQARSPDGDQQPTSPAVDVASDKAAASDDAKRFDPKAQGDGGACSVSASVDGKMNCKNTEATIKGAEMANMLGQAVTTAATQMSGQAAQAKAAQDGSQSAAIKGASDTAKSTATMESASGLMNVALGAMQWMMGNKHEANTKQISGGADASKVHLMGTVATQNAAKTRDKTEAASLSSLANKQQPENGGAIDLDSADGSAAAKFQDTTQSAGKSRDPNGNPGKGYNLRDTATVTAIKYDDGKSNSFGAKIVAKYGDSGSGELSNISKGRAYAAGKQSTSEAFDKVKNQSLQEQKAMADNAQAGALKSIMAGITGLVAAKLHRDQAGYLEDAAKTMAQTQASGVPLGFQGADPMAQGDSGSHNNAVTSQDATNAAAVATDDSGKAITDPGLGGDPINTNPPGDTPTGAGPEPGSATPMAAGGGAGGGSGGGLGSASTGGGAGAPPDGDPSAQMNIKANPDKYGEGSGGGGMMSGGSGPKDAAVSGVDLNGLLAQFLPKKEDEQGKGILDFASRAPAAMPDSLLSRETNIFQRIHDAYQVKHKRGQVGI